VVKELMEKFGIRHHNSTPYYPQTNGQVERFNRTLKESLAKLSIENTDWDLHIAPVLFAYRTAKQSTTKITPFMLTYEREAKLPLDEDVEKDSITFLDRIKFIIDKLPKIREKAKQTMITAKERQKTAHDKNMSNPTHFYIGQKVLYYDAAKANQWSGKLDPKWKGPYRIHEILINGSYKIREMDGKILVKPVNGDLLKEYHDRQSWETYVVID